MTDLFITSTLHSDWNISFNPKLCSDLEQRGIKCHLPQRDTNQTGSRKDVFQQNIDGIKNSEKVLCIASNESVNLGGEVGFAFGINKKIVALKNKDHEIPLMLRYMASDVVEADDINNIEQYIEELVQKIKK
ncbi:MAG: nucleoside 2-deoxyribosyltransferase [bacterium]|nr:nucleoside 2-deoxyribosyltransferase [bacterium]